MLEPRIVVAHREDVWWLLSEAAPLEHMIMCQYLFAAFSLKQGTEEGLTAEQAAGGSPDVRWLVTGEAGEGHFYTAGDRLPFGIEAFPGHKHNDLVLWIPDRAAVVAGDTLAEFGRGLEINERWLTEGLTREQVAERLRPLLDLPVEHVLATHGGPMDRAALERALS